MAALTVLLQPTLAIFGAGTTELIIILAVLLILFGNRLPSVMRSLGQGITEFKRGVRDDSANQDAITSDTQDDNDASSSAT